MAGGAGATNEPAALAELFHAQFQVQTPGPELLSLQPGSLLVAAELWPAQALGKGMAALSPVVRDALARPSAGARLLVYDAASVGQGGQTAAGEGQQGQCTRVFVRMCQMEQAAGGTGTAGPAAAAPALLPPDDAPATADCGRAGPQQSPPSGRQRQASTPQGRGAVQSPAMRGGGAPPVALSPAMRGGGPLPVALISPGGARSRPGSATLQDGKAAGALPAAPPACGTGSSSSSTVGSEKSPMRGRTTDKAKAQALLASLLGEGELVQLATCVP